MTRRDVALCLSLVVLLIGLSAAQDRSDAGGSHDAFSMRVLAGRFGRSVGDELGAGRATMGH